MATKEGKQWWDPYETSNRRHFIYRPSSATEVPLCPTSASFLDSYSKSAPFGSTVYNKDFCWNPACKPECIRTGTASGQRKNNPHPSQSFMMWRRPRDAARTSEYVSYPWKCPPSEGEICEALAAQYRSTYRCDFMSVPQGYDRIYNAERRLAIKRSTNAAAPSTDTEMRDNYRQPKQKPELLHRSYRRDLNMVCHGIVPTVMQRNIHSQQKRSDLTNCDRTHGKRGQTDELRCVSFANQEALVFHPNNREKVNKLPAVAINSCSPE